MVFILAASSLHHALETLNPEAKEQFKDKIYTITGLSLNPNTKNRRKIVQIFFQKILKIKKTLYFGMMFQKTAFLDIVATVSVHCQCQN